MSDIPADAIVIDIDGTLADVEHRRHHVRGGNKDWDAFFEAMVDDPPKEAVCSIVEAIGREYGDPYIFFFTGRPNKYREATTDWLMRYVPQAYTHSEDLMMRADGDFRSDVEVKRAMLRIVENQGFDVRCVIDDRPSVVAMWKEEGIQVLEVDSGDWDETKAEPGKLVMLVGPSGAGKTTYRDTLWEPEYVYSSDALRVQICGDMTDQTRNNEVFAALHRMAVARVESGLETVIDATNLREREHRWLSITTTIPNTTIGLNAGNAAALGVWRIVSKMSAFASIRRAVGNAATFARARAAGRIRTIPSHPQPPQTKRTSRLCAPKPVSRERLRMETRHESDTRMDFRPSAMPALPIAGE